MQRYEWQPLRNHSLSFGCVFCLEKLRKWFDAFRRKGDRCRRRANSDRIRMAQHSDETMRRLTFISVAWWLPAASRNKTKLMQAEHLARAEANYSGIWEGAGMLILAPRIGPSGVSPCCVVPLVPWLGNWGPG